jgi:hypothetical protein
LDLSQCFGAKCATFHVVAGLLALFFDQGASCPRSCHDITINAAYAVAAPTPASRTALETLMKRKPDLLWVLVILFGLGVVTTGYTQSLWQQPVSEPASVTLAR